MSAIVRRRLLLLTALALPGGIFAQQRRGGDNRNKVSPKDATPGLLVEFHGVLRRLEKGKLELVVEGDQELTFFVNKKTAFFEGKKPVKSGEKLVGTLVTIEARPEFLKDLVAVHVTGGLGESETPANPRH
ncbi:MAG: hypothetical protein JNK87_13090 [Bryobacterales bacterium]|nr:hypothetical protein [Bryobacterales bacterium]